MDESNVGGSIARPVGGWVGGWVASQEGERQTVSEI